MADYGITVNGFVMKRLDEIYSSVCSSIKEEIGVDPSENPQGILNVLTTIFCDQIASLWEDYSNGYEQLFPLTATGIALDRVMEVGGVNRIGKSRTKYALACTGKEGTVIPAGSLVQSNTYPVRQFQCATIGEISSKNWQTLCIQPIESITGSFKFTFSIERNATSGIVGTIASESNLSDDLTVTSYDDAVTQITEALSGFDHLKRLGISISNGRDAEGKKTIILSGNNASDSFSSSVCSYITISEVTSNLTFESVEYGNQPLANDTITKIVTSIDGFESVTNKCTPIEGRLEQTDAEARSSYLYRLANRAQGTVASVVAVLYSDVSGVTYATGFQNDTNEEDSAGRPPHSMEIIVQGGDDEEIANAIWKNKAAGIRAYGSNYAYATDTEGQKQYVEFTKVNRLYLLLSVKITSSEGLDDDYITRIQSLLASETLEAGSNVKLQKFIRPIMENVSGVDFVEIYGKLSSTPDLSNVEDDSMSVGVVQVKSNEQPVLTANCIRVVKAT